MDQHDEESIPRLPEDNEYESSAIEERPPFFSRRRKAIAAAVVSVVVAGAVTAGVALSMKPGAPPPDQNGIVQSTPVVDAADAEPSGSAEQERPGDEYDEPASDETPQEEEVHREEAPAGAGDANAADADTDADADAADDEDEELDIIIDVGYEPEHPEDVILNSGFAQREPEPEVELILPPTADAYEKVEYNSEDFALETAVFEGPVTDFIVTPYLSRITVTTSSTCPKANEGLWKMTLETDNYPWETYWELMDRNNDVVAFGPPKRRNYARSTKYIGQMCFKAGQYKLRLGDKNSDGFCCKYGRGSVVVQVNGKTVVSQRGNQSFKEKVFTFPIRGVGNPKPSTPQPTPKPTPKPTPPPTIPLDINPSLLCKNVDIKVVTDRFGGETSYKFTPDNNPKQILLEKQPGSMLGETTYKDTVCVQDGKYRITVTDPFQGIQGGGYYSVTVDGEEVMYGDVFQEEEQVHVIRVGYNPPMSARDREWLDAHNVRRTEYFQQEGKPDKPLVWSPQLAEEASNWVDEILPTCKIVRQPSLREGENISARTSGGTRDEGPIPILERWTEKKKDLGYPKNQSMTQVLWRGSRYVGCSEKSRQRPNGTWCYVSLCRYARAGNCSMQQYKDWKTATLVDRTKCGPICPESGNECY